MLCDLFGVCGPIVAVGRPGERLAPLGASRFWVGDDRWQQVVDELIRESQLVIMIMGATHGDDGLAWEVRHVFHLQQTAKLVLILPPLEEESARQRWESFRPLCQGRLPPHQGGELAAIFTSDNRCSVARNPDLGYYRSKPDEDDYRSGLLVESVQAGRTSLCSNAEYQVPS